MSEQQFIIEREFDVPITKVWEALTKKEQMKKWYFDLPDFKPVVGFEFQFIAGEEGHTPYKHLCQVKEVVPGKKLAYSWRYDGYPGDSLVTFELMEMDKITRLKITHSGLETLAGGGPDFAKEKFTEGWTSLLDKSLRGYLAEEAVRRNDL